jgi:hypothetical protein
MQTKTVIQFSTVPSFRRRWRHVLGAMRRLVSRPGDVDIPDHLREDIGQPHRGRRPRANAPPGGNPYWRI